MSSDPHLGFIIAAYGATAVALVATLAVLLIDLRSQKTLLRRFGRNDQESQ